MCARFTLTVSLDTLSDVFDVAMPGGGAPRYNIAPTQGVLCVREVTGGREAATLRWGLIPFWAKDPSIGAKLINARGETLAEKPSFRAAFRERRCLIPADGFYEWQSTNGRQPVYIRMADGGVFAFAGLWERWKGPEGPVETCTLITTSPNELMAPIHDRMPVILPRDAYGAWLSPGATPDVLGSLLSPYPAGEMASYRVSKLVNNPRNDDAQCIAPAV
jgi:putative SOS response-associated peptidase YedK